MAAYARVAVPRTTAGWTVSGNNATLTAIVSFPPMAGGAGGPVSYFGCGLAATLAGQMVFFGTVTPNISVVNGVTPKLDTGTTISQATADNMSNTAATNLLLLLFNNTTWATFGDATGIVGSGTAGSLYLSLHTGILDETSTQATSEIAYT
jgi:hypothetical protein